MKIQGGGFMKSVWVLCLALCICMIVQAGNYRKREVSHPCFIAANTSKIEIKKIVLSNEQTQVDAVLYGKPGEAAVISSNTCLRSAQQEFALREAEGVSIDGQALPEQIPSSGEHHITLSFAPIPAGVHTVDFVEKDEGWTIWGIQLSGAEPYVFVPSFLKTEKVERAISLPEPKLKSGKAIVNGYILGYDSRMDVDVVFRHSDWLLYNDWGKTIKVRQDGSFHIEVDLLLAGGARLQINKAQLDLFLVPGTELTVYVHLPRLSMSASRLLKRIYAGKRKAWFDGGEAALNTELAMWGYPLSVASLPGSEDKMADMPKEKYIDYVQNMQEKLESQLLNDKRVGEAYRKYVSINLKMNTLVLLGDRGRSPELMEFPYCRYGYDYVSYLQLLEQNNMNIPDIWEEIKKTRIVYQNVIKEQRLKSVDKKLLNSIGEAELYSYVKHKIKVLQAISERAQASKSYVIAELDTLVSGADILPAIISKHRGSAVLVDFWATWCGPCRKSMHAIRPLKEKLSGKDIVYIYVTGPSSPEDIWNVAITEINGVHYRLTKEQWNYLCKTYGIKGIPGYLVISYDGKLQDRYVGFPGVDVLQKDLLRAME